jgi:hypothetical protein
MTARKKGEHSGEEFSLDKTERSAEKRKREPNTNGKPDQP